MNHPGMNLHQTFFGQMLTLINWNFDFRFGLTNAVKTTVPVKKDEEYFVEYGYAYNIVAAPKWYRDLFRQFVKQEKDPSEEYLEKIDQINELEAKQAKLTENSFKDSINPQ